MPGSGPTRVVNMRRAKLVVDFLVRVGQLYLMTKEGDTPTPHKTAKTTEERFWGLVDKTGECWVWLGTKLEKGYGTFRINSPRRKVLAHRFSFELHFGAPSKPQICHSCDNPSCVRPSHLWNGTNADNVADMVEKGRVQKGDRHYRRRRATASTAAPLINVT